MPATMVRDEAERLRALVAELRSTLRGHDHAHAREIAAKDKVIAKQDARIAALESELLRLREAYAQVAKAACLFDDLLKEFKENKDV